MKHINLVLLLSFLTLSLSAQSDTSAFRQHALAIQKKFAPDKRSVYFNLQVKGDSIQLESTSAAAISEFERTKPELGILQFSSVVLPTKSLNGLYYAVVNLSVGNHRANPQNAAELMTQTLLGTPVQVFKKQGGYYLVKSPDGYLSWIDGGAIKLMDKQQFEVWKNSTKVVFMPEYGHSYVGTNADGERVSDLVAGNILQLLGQEKGFYKVAYPDGRVAYLPKKEADLYQQWVQRPNPNADKILATAKKMLGVPYLWGGTSIKGVDCSGFTKTAYFINGIIIPRDASQQALVGSAIDVLEHDSISVSKCLTNLQPGDLLFFSAAKRRGINGGRVSHTAIYMGNGEFIQSAGMVKISSIIATSSNYDPAQSSTLVGARRFLTEIGQPEITRVEQHDWYGGK